MRIKMDLHVHTSNSPDGFTSLNEVAQAALKRGLDGLAITDHDVRTEPDQISQSTGSIMVLPGVEVRVGHYHILGIGVEAWEREHQPSLRSAVGKIHDVGGLAVFAHPYNSLFRHPSLEDVQSAKVDAIETVNAGVQLFALGTNMASKAASTLKLPQTGGSDSHIPQTVGDAYTIIEVDRREPKGVLEAIRGGRTEALGRATSLGDRLQKLRLQIAGKKHSLYI